MNRSRTPVAVALGAVLALLALLVLAGCSVGSSDDAMGGESMAETMDGTVEGADMGAPEMADEAAGGGMDSSSAFLSDGDMADGDVAVQDRAADVVDAASAEEGAQQASIISTGTVSLRADDVGDARFEVQKVVDRVGGQVTDSETRTDDDGAVRTARLVLRVPSAEFTETMDALEKVADLEASSTTSEDVTTQVVDTNVRIRVQRQSIARIEQLLDRAGSIRDIVAVERQLTDREARLNSLLRQQAYLADQTSLSTITVHLQRHRVDVGQGKNAHVRESFLNPRPPETDVLHVGHDPAEEEATELAHEGRSFHVLHAFCHGEIELFPDLLGKKTVTHQIAGFHDELLALVALLVAEF